MGLIYLMNKQIFTSKLINQLIYKITDFHIVSLSVFPQLIIQMAQNQNEMLIYSMDLDEEDNENKDYLSTTSKSNQYKTTPPQAQIINARTIDTLHSTQIIKINPNPHSQFQDFNQNQPNTQQISVLQAKRTQKLENDETNKEYTSDNQDQQDESPARLKKPRRKRMDSPLKRRKNLEQQIIDYENIQQMHQNQSFSDKLSQKSNFENKNDEDCNVKKKWRFQTIEKKQSNEEQNNFKLQSYMQMEDSERNFQLKKEQRPKPENKFSKNKKVRKVDSNIQLLDQQQVRQIQSSQVLIDDSSIDSEEYKDSSEEEQIYQNDPVSEEQKQAMLFTNKFQSSTQQIKIIRQLSKQVLVQTTLQSLIMDPVPKGMKMVCRFFLQTKYFGMSKQYNFVIESSGRTILSAKKEHFSFTGSKFVISLNKDFISKRKENQFWTGRLQSNFSGTSYQLIQRNFAGSENSFGKNLDTHLNKQIEEIQNSQKYEESLAAIINFENNLWGFSGIRKMQIIKLDRQKLTSRDIMKSVTLDGILQRNEMSKITKIQTTKPQYNKATKRYNLNFEKKAKIPSAKNIILHWNVPQKIKSEDKKQSRQLKNSFSNIDQITLDESIELNYREDKKIQKELKIEQKKNPIKSNKIQCLLVGKQSQKQYLVEVSHPLSIFEAFGACLANEDTKYMVN